MKKLNYILLVGAIIIIASVVLSFKSLPKPTIQAFIEARDVPKGNDLSSVNAMIITYKNQGYKMVGITSYQISPGVERIIVAFE